MMSSAYLHYSKATQNVLMSSLPVLWSHPRSGLEQDSDDQQWRPLVEKELLASDCIVTVSR